LSFIFIYALHNIFIFFKSTLTTPKIKDFVYSPTKSYDEIYKTLNKNSAENNTTLINDLKQIDDKEQMKDDLKSFLKNQLKL
jgi:hypothetical protein